jgi:hypothetical protein
MFSSDQWSELRDIHATLVRAAAALAHLLYQNPQTKPVIGVIPSIVRGTAYTVGQLRANGQPVTPRTVSKIIARRTYRTLGNPNLLATALARNLASTQTLARRRYYYGRTRRPYGYRYGRRPVGYRGYHPGYRTGIRRPVGYRSGSRLGIRRPVGARPGVRRSPVGYRSAARPRYAAPIRRSMAARPAAVRRVVPVRTSAPRPAMRAAAAPRRRVR